ncbi:nitroreductase family protein [Candidatus Woesearchaeota archaeon]|nr:nitroreductase family protein [Candidatus Woesearchaeota archaeon]
MSGHHEHVTRHGELAGEEPLSHFIHLIKNRRSIRKYKGKEIPWGLILQILEAGRYAPSAGNVQNWKFIVVRNPGVRESIAKCCHSQEWMQDAPVHIVVVGEPKAAGRFYGERGETLYTAQGCAAAIENMMLAAASLGLGTCWVSAFDDFEISKILDFPEDVVCQGVVTLGYSDEHPLAPARKDLHTVVFVNSWGDKGYGDKAKGYKSANIKEAVSQIRGSIENIAKKIKGRNS